MISAASLLHEIADGVEPFAVISRSGTGGVDRSFVGSGRSLNGTSVADLEARATAEGSAAVLAVPYAQVRERGFEARPSSARLTSVVCERRGSTTRAELLRLLPAADIGITRKGFDLTDAQYAGMVRAVIDEEIGGGEGANFVLHRAYRGHFARFDRRVALAAYRRLLAGETGAYWTFLIGLPDRYLIGASPELHIEQDAFGTVRMNPISGTLRFGDQPPTVEDYLAFLRDTKEREELLMVVDEELKTMSRIGSGPPRIKGPYLKEMSRLAHTEYLIEVHSDLAPGRVLTESLLAPTVTGSPLENACRVVARHETTDRGYYSGVIALVDPTAGGPRPELDSAIVIRTADIALDGSFSLPVGATVVRHSDPETEALETAAKASGLLNALTAPRTAAEDPQIADALRERNTDLARFWIDGDTFTRRATERKPRIIIVDYEDRFTDMLARQLESLGLEVESRSHDQVIDPSDTDLTILGPGPGDPTGHADGRIQSLREHVDQLLDAGAPFLAICLSHQALSAALGLRLERLPNPNQGVQRTVEFYGEHVKVAFYNAYTALSSADRIDHPKWGSIDVARVRGTDNVIGVRAHRFESFQFHPESLLSADGHRLLRQSVERLKTGPVL